MALIKDAKGRKIGSGYERLFGNKLLGGLISKIQSAVISSGNELEKIILAKVKTITNLDEFLKIEIISDGVLVAPKTLVKKCVTLQTSGAEPDFIIFKRRSGRQRCHIVELKDGDAFDTKKAAAERRNMHDFISKNAQHLPYTVSAHFCCFNQNDKEEIYNGFKRKIDIGEVMTGKEFCELLELNYDEIVEGRRRDQLPNFKYFLDELLKIQEIKDYIHSLFG